MNTFSQLTGKVTAKLAPARGCLVILSPGFPKDEQDSTCIPAQQQFVRAMNEQFPSLKIIIVSFQYPFSGTNYRWNGNLVMPLNGRNRKKIQRALTWARAWGTLRKIKKSQGIIGLFSFWCTECAMVGQYFSKIYRIPHFIWILGQDARKMNNFFVKLIRPSGLELVAMSDFLSSEFYRNYSVRPAYTIPNGIDPSLYKTAPIKRDIDVLGVGSLIPLKKYDMFLHVVKELAFHLPHIQSRICGKGHEFQDLQLLAGLLGIEDNVLLTGEKPHDEVLELMQRAKILIHTSSYEGFPSVCLEALYAGAHVISFCQPMTALVDHWHIVDNWEELVEKALNLLSDCELDHRPVLVNSMGDTARAIATLFGQD
jgi:glycosyltransferase involved in cell wall biosynthesis